MEYNSELKELTGIDISKFDGVVRCPECGIEVDKLDDVCDGCGFPLSDD